MAKSHRGSNEFADSLMSTPGATTVAPPSPLAFCGASARGGALPGDLRIGRALHHPKQAEVPIQRAEHGIDGQFDEPVRSPNATLFWMQVERDAISLDDQVSDKPPLVAAPFRLRHYNPPSLVQLPPQGTIIFYASKTLVDLNQQFENSDIAEGMALPERSSAAARHSS
jgi:hypothetical protein